MDKLTGRKRIRFWRNRIIVQLEYSYTTPCPYDAYESPPVIAWRDASASAKDVDDVASVLTLFPRSA